MSFPVVPRSPAADRLWIDRNPGTSKAISYQVLNEDPATGAFVWLVKEHAGFRGGVPGHGHYLPVDEEAFFLEGRQFAQAGTSYDPLDYLFYPAGFLHSPTWGDEGSLFVLRCSGPMSYLDVPMPANRDWLRADERQAMADLPHRRQPVSHLATPDLAWERLVVAGAPTGEMIKILSSDRTTGAVTFLWSVPAGWSAPLGTASAQREWFVVSGDVDFGETALGLYDYRCADAGQPGPIQSVGGGVCLCWSAGPLGRIDEAGRTMPLWLA